MSAINGAVLLIAATGWALMVLAAITHTNTQGEE